MTLETRKWVYVGVWFVLDCLGCGIGSLVGHETLVCNLVAWPAMIWLAWRYQAFKMMEEE